MKLQAVKFGLAAAIVAGVFWLVGRLLLLAAPFGPMRGGGLAAQGYMRGGYMMRGYGRYMMGGNYPNGHMVGLGWGGYFAGLVVGLIVVPLVAGMAAWATATVYNRLLDPSAPCKPAEDSVD
ncbi:MAG: hypothetical protein ACXWJC_07905 [Croceibacterium sp.]